MSTALRSLECADSSIQSQQKRPAVSLSDMQQYGDRSSQSNSANDRALATSGLVDDKTLPSVEIVDAGKQIPTATRDTPTHNTDVITDFHNKDGSYGRKDTHANGNVTFECHGPSPKDNFTRTDYANGDQRVQFADHRGYSMNYDGQGGHVLHTWGPHSADNETRTVYANGDFRVERGDGTGFAHTYTEAGYVEKHWGPKAQDNESTSKRIDPSTGNAEHVHQVAAEYSRLPEKDRMIMDDAGAWASDGKSSSGCADAGPRAASANENSHSGSVLSAPNRMIDRFPQLEQAQPRGYEKGSNFRNSPAATFPGDNTHDTEMVIATSYQDLRSSKWIDYGDVTHAVAHESGHVLDGRLGGLSNQPEFIAAYEKDLRAATPADRSNFDYYYQAGGAGPQETFAELYSLLRTGAGRQGLQEKFPSCTQLLVKELSQIDSGELKWKSE